MSETEYPHEIGIFLGYPLADVLGFMHQQKCCYVQDWKVYDDQESTRWLFSLFAKTRMAFIDGFESGKTIAQLMTDSV